MDPDSFLRPYVIYQQFDDLKKGVEGLSSPVRFSSAGAICLVILSGIAGSASNRDSGLAGLALYLLSGILFAVTAFLVQRAANVWQEARYPGRPMREMTTGEVIATVLGVIFLLVVIVGSLIPA